MTAEAQNLGPIESAFAKAFIEAISAKSVEGCADLVLTYEDCAALGVDFGLSQRAYRKRLKKQSKNFLKEKREFIDKKNADPNSAITVENFVAIDTYEFALEDGFEAGFIKTISISMKIRRVDGMCYQVGFQINDAVFVNGNIRINNLHGVRMSESYWEEITKENTSYPLITDKAELRGIIQRYAPKYVDREYINILDYYSNWYVHEGDLTLESYLEVKVNLIVTGNLTFKEPVTSVTRELIVLGRTSVNALVLEDTNDALFLGGVDFAVSAFVIYTSAYIILNRPRGPFLCAYCETLEIDDLSGIQHLYAPELDANADFSQFLLDGFYEASEPDEGYEGYELNYPAVLEAIRAGRSIFKP